MAHCRETSSAGRAAASHPRGVQPTANRIFSSLADGRDAGLGRLAALDDALILQVLEHLPAGDLGRLATSNRALYCFASHEPLWQAFVIEGTDNGFDFKGTWKTTYMHTIHGSHAGLPFTNACALTVRTVPEQGPTHVGGIFSDLLHQSWFLGRIDIDSDWLEVDNIPRQASLSVQDFREQYELPNSPVVLEGAASSWPAVQKWSDEYLEAAFGDKPVLAGEYPMSFGQYRMYAEQTTDEMPLYLFDKHFVESAPKLAEDYSVPEYFEEDLFSVLGSSRPDYRWIIIGPEKSGSTFHKDPNSTSAWNAVIRGSKKWILYPPSYIPPGVHASKDGADVVTSVSLMEWMVNHYHQTKSSAVRPVEGVVREGDVIFVPRGWWHMAINLEPTVAITQNYVSAANLPNVLRFLRPGRADLVSGCATGERDSLYARFHEALQQHRPEALVDAMKAEERYQANLAGQHHLTSLFSVSKKPSQAGEAQQTSGGGFSFGFKL